MHLPVFTGIMLQVLYKGDFFSYQTLNFSMDALIFKGIVNSEERAKPL